jgi:hypothetical protein
MDRSEWVCGTFSPSHAESICSDSLIDDGRVAVFVRVVVVRNVFVLLFQRHEHTIQRAVIPIQQGIEYTLYCHALLLPYYNL